MPSTINADNGVSSGSAGLKSAADASGVLQLQTNGTTALAVSTAQVVTLTNALGVSSGGSGLSSATSYTLLAGGTTSTGAFQQVSGTGTSGQLLTSNGAGALPSWQNAPSGMVYPGAGVAVSTGSAWGTSLTAASANTASALVQRDASGNFSAGTITATLSGNSSGVATTNWTITETGGVLYFKYGGVNKAKLDSSGNLTVTGNVTAYGTV